MPLVVAVIIIMLSSSRFGISLYIVHYNSTLHIRLTLYFYENVDNMFQEAGTNLAEMMLRYEKVI